MVRDEEGNIEWYTIGVLLMFSAMIGGVIWFIIFYYRQEQGITGKLDECSFYTIATPVKMSTSHIVYFNFSYKDIKYEQSANVGAEDLGISYTTSEILSSRYWIKVYCKDLHVNRIIWKHPVPDTLQYVPAEGWKDIPYGLWYKFNEE